MAVNQFIPKVWSARILQKLQSTLVYGQAQIVNTDYQGEISEHGDTVYIHGHSDVTVSPYIRNTTTLNYQLLNDERRSITIDQSDYFAVSVDDLDAAQTKPKLLDSVAQDAAYQLARVQDTYISGLGVAGAGGLLEGAAGAARQITAANAYTTFVEASVMLDEKNIPEDGRYAVVPPWMAAELLKDDRYFLQAKGDAVLNGQIGTIAGIAILKSNRVPVGTSVYSVLIGHNMAISFASQINKVEGLRAVNSFADLLRGLTLYGGKVLYPEALIKLRATK
jgi:N4-gp56 family major capsid protein